LRLGGVIPQTVGGRDCCRVQGQNGLNFSQKTRRFSRQKLLRAARYQWSEPTFFNEWLRGFVGSRVNRDSKTIVRRPGSHGPGRPGGGPRGLQAVGQEAVEHLEGDGGLVHGDHVARLEHLQEREPRRLPHPPRRCPVHKERRVRRTGGGGPPFVAFRPCVSMCWYGCVWRDGYVSVAASMRVGGCGWYMIRKGARPGNQAWASLFGCGKPSAGRNAPHTTDVRPSYSSNSIVIHRINDRGTN